MARFCLFGADKIEDEEDRPMVFKRLKLTATASSTAPNPPPPPPPPPVVLSPEPVHTSGFSEEEYSERSQYSDEDEESDEEQEESENQQEGVIEELINQQAVVNKETSNDRSLTLTLTDPDLLDCPICIENLNIPVFQCWNGHIACGSCCLKIRYKCPTCSLAIGYNRCRAIEKLLEAVQVSCGNMKYGCKDMMKYFDKRQHENSCIYSPCFCPIDECDFVDSASNLYTHFPSKHTATNFLFNSRFTVYLERNNSSLFLREETLGTLFVLNQFSEYQLNAVSVVLIAPNSPIVKYCYELEARDGDTSLTLQSPVECVPKLGDYRPTKHVLVVEDFPSPAGYLRLNICIRPYGHR